MTENSEAKSANTGCGCLAAGPEDVMSVETGRYNDGQRSPPTKLGTNTQIARGRLGSEKG